MSKIGPEGEDAHHHHHHGEQESMQINHTPDHNPTPSNNIISNKNHSPEGICSANCNQCEQCTMKERKSSSSDASSTASSLSSIPSDSSSATAATVQPWIQFCLVLTQLGGCLVNCWLDKNALAQSASLNVHQLCQFIVALQNFSKHAFVSYLKVHKWGVAVADNKRVIVAIFSTLSSDDKLLQRYMQSLKLKSVQILNAFTRLYDAKITMLLDKEEKESEQRLRNYTAKNHDSHLRASTETLHDFVQFEQYIVRSFETMEVFEELWFKRLLSLEGALHAVLVDPYSELIWLQSADSASGAQMKALCGHSSEFIWSAVVNCCRYHTESFTKSEKDSAPKTSVFELILNSSDSSLFICVRIVRIVRATCLVLYYSKPGTNNAQHSQLQDQPTHLASLSSNDGVLLTMGDGSSVYFIRRNEDFLPQPLRKALNSVGKRISHSFPTKVKSFEDLQRSLSFSGSNQSQQPQHVRKHQVHDTAETNTSADETATTSATASPKTSKAYNETAESDVHSADNENNPSHEHSPTGQMQSQQHQQQRLEGVHEADLAVRPTVGEDNNEPNLAVHSGGASSSAPINTSVLVPRPPSLPSQRRDQNQHFVRSNIAAASTNSNHNSPSRPRSRSINEADHDTTLSEGDTTSRNAFVPKPPSVPRPTPPPPRPTATTTATINETEAAIASEAPQMRNPRTQFINRILNKTNNSSITTTTTTIKDNNNNNSTPSEAELLLYAGDHNSSNNANTNNPIPSISNNASSPSSKHHPTTSSGDKTTSTTTTSSVLPINLDYLKELSDLSKQSLPSDRRSTTPEEQQRNLQQWQRGEGVGVDISDYFLYNDKGDSKFSVQPAPEATATTSYQLPPSVHHHDHHQQQRTRPRSAPLNHDISATATATAPEATTRDSKYGHILARRSSQPTPLAPPIPPSGRNESDGDVLRYDPIDAGTAAGIVDPATTTVVQQAQNGVAAAPAPATTTRQKKPNINIMDSIY